MKTAMIVVDILIAAGMFATGHVAPAFVLVSAVAITLVLDLYIAHRRRQRDGATR